MAAVKKKVASKNGTTKAKEPGTDAPTATQATQETNGSAGSEANTGTEGAGSPDDNQADAGAAAQSPPEQPPSTQGNSPASSDGADGQAERAVKSIPSELLIQCSLAALSGLTARTGAAAAYLDDPSKKALEIGHMMARRLVDEGVA